MTDDPRLPDPGERSERERTVEAAIGRYLDRLASGETVDPDEVLLENPELGAAILAELKTFVKLGAREPMVGAGVLGDYRLIRQVGRGGMGVVYEAWQGSLERLRGGSEPGDAGPRL